jgi:hypothetical protein
MAAELEDTTFIWQGTDGRIHREPITYFEVPESVALIEADRCEPLGISDTSAAEALPAASAPVGAKARL